MLRAWVRVCARTCACAQVRLCVCACLFGRLGRRVMLFMLLLLHGAGFLIAMTTLPGSKPLLIKKTIS